MNLYFKIILVIFGLAYLISPVDIIPDILLPYIGWIDDGIVIGTIVYLFRYGKLPNFFFKKQPPFKTAFDTKTSEFTSNRQTNGRTDREKQDTRTVPKTPYEILGIRPNATKNEIHSAYKDAIKKYHPDKLSHLGEEFSSLANEKFIEIQAAYDTLIQK